MFFAITLLIIIAAIVLAFFNVTAAWVLLAIPFVFYLTILYVLKRKSYPDIDELSDGANEMIQKHGFYYAMPDGSSDLAGSCGALGLAGIVVAVISCFHGAWWSIAVAVALFAITLYAAQALNPDVYIAPAKRAYHDEVLEWMQTTDLPVRAIFAPESLRSEAERGDANAQNELGVAHGCGMGVIHDHHEAVKWWHKAVEQGHAGAQYNLGCAYLFGEGTIQSWVEARKLLRKAAQQGHAGASETLKQLEP